MHKIGAEGVIWWWDAHQVGAQGVVGRGGASGVWGGEGMSERWVQKAYWGGEGMVKPASGVCKRRAGESRNGHPRA